MDSNEKDDKSESVEVPAGYVIEEWDDSDIKAADALGQALMDVFQSALNPEGKKRVLN